MDRFYSLNIQNEQVRILEIESKDDIFYIKNQQTVDICKLSAFLKNKKSYYITITQEEIIDEKIEIESAIKSDSVIRKIIYAKLTESGLHKKIIFNYRPIDELKNSKKITYQVDGVYEDDCLRLLKKIDNHSEIKSVSTNKFALFGISCRCIQDNSYFSINTFEDKLIIIVVHNNTLIFSREYTIIASDSEERKKKFIEEITQTIAYTQQHFRDIKFSFIALSGSISVDDDILEHIYILSGLGVCTLYPNTFVKGVKNQELHDIIISIGGWLIPQKYQFIPTSVLGTNRYYKISKIIAVFSFILFLAASAFTYKQFEEYSKSFKEYEVIRNKAFELHKSTKIYSDKELLDYLDHIQITKNYMQYHPIDSIAAIKPLIKLQKPQNITWDHNDDFMSISAPFKHSFNTLGELYDFEKLFFGFIDNIDKTSHTAYHNKTNYVTMDFNVAVTVQNGTKQTKEISRKKRQ